MPDHRNQDQRSRAVPPVLSSREAMVDERGTAAIPEGTREIFDMAFQGNPQLVRVVLPDSVRKVGSRAFAGCENLREVHLNDGLEILEGNAFNGCTCLEELVLPDSLRQVHAYALYHTSFRAPVYNRSGTILYHYPEQAPVTFFAVPQRVKRLAHGAFLECAALKEVHLPEGLEVIEREAFVNTAIRSITIPASVKAVEGLAFWNCRNLEQVELLCDSRAVDTGAFNQRNHKLQFQQPLLFLEELRLQGTDPLDVSERLKIPENGFWWQEAFISHAMQCAKGDPGAMMEFAAYLESLGTHKFFSCAANFWRYRANLYGDLAAIQWMRQWASEHPKQQIPSVIRSTLKGNADGLTLRALGFLFFDPCRKYHLHGLDRTNIVQVCSWCDEEGPDEDGFGREELYDWWYLDEHLNQLPGVEMLHSYSYSETRTLFDRFAAQHAAAARAVRERRQRKTPTGR